MADQSLHLSIADQCIVCLETLGKVNVRHEGEVAPDAETPVIEDDNNEEVATIRECGHILHALCLKDWIEKANSCPICRQTFYLVDVYDKIGGEIPTPWLKARIALCVVVREAFQTHLECPHYPDHLNLMLTSPQGTKLNTFPVEDKKQVADFDPTAWIEDQADDLFESHPCPICNSSDDEDVLLLCDACDAPYHTYCVGLENVPRGHWFCMECQYEGSSDRAADPSRATRGRGHPRTFAQRTQAQVRRGRRSGRADGWHSAWDALTERVWDALNMDLDAPEYQEDESISAYRSHQRRTEIERREFQQWQRRLNIASRQGARDIFRLASRPIFNAREPPKTPEQTPEEKKAWDAFEKARDMDVNGSASRKRKSRSITQSPSEKEAQEPERKLKRPRTRRVVDKPGSSSGGQSSRRQSIVPAVSAPVPQPEAIAPSFLSSLLKEVEKSVSTDDESIPCTHQATATSPSIDHSSPAVSPSTSNYSTPRALSTTPPPNGIRRPGSPLPLTSHIEPIFPPAEYSPNRSPPDHRSSDGPGSPAMTPELRQPRPRHKQPALPRSEETSPTRANMSIEAKEGINRIVRHALDPHYKKPSGITKEQYANINRTVSRMLYDRVAEEADAKTMLQTSVEASFRPEDGGKEKWESIAKREVKKAVEGLIK